jgi:hypothetical protein
MGNHITGHCQTQANTTSPRVQVVDIQKQLIGIEVTQSFNVVITIT